jgi:hypothetical protein
MARLVGVASILAVTRNIGVTIVIPQASYA